MDKTYYNIALFLNIKVFMQKEEQIEIPLSKTKLILMLAGQLFLSYQGYGLLVNQKN